MFVLNYGNLCLRRIAFLEVIDLFAAHQSLCANKKLCDTLRQTLITLQRSPLDCGFVHSKTGRHLNLRNPLIRGNQRFRQL